MTEVSERKSSEEGEDEGEGEHPEEERSRMPRGGYGDISTHTGVTGGADLTGSSCEVAGLD